MNLMSRKAQTISIIAFILCLLFFIFTLVYGTYARILAMNLLSWQIFSGLMVWLVLIIQFYQQNLAEQEKLDLSQLSKSTEQGSIFAGGGDRIAMMEVAQKRLKFFEKWILPFFSVVLGIYQILMGLSLLHGQVLDIPRRNAEWSDPQNPLLGAMLMVGVSFVSFLFSRYATGMSAETVWKPLRAGGSYLLATALLGFILAISLALEQFKYPQGLAILIYLIPVMLIVLGGEILMNAVLDIYRPRVTGQYNRAAFDSRILGLINEPGGILHTVAHTIDYQFGFQVSQTWFYKLLEKAIFPLILFALLVLYLMSSFVVIDAGHAGVIERYGVPVRESDSSIRVLKPGLKLKWPWPIEKVYIYPTDQIQQINIGYAGEKKENAFLWGVKHYENEYDLLVAVESDSSIQGQGAVPVSIVQANVPILYRIRDIGSFLYNHRDSRELLEAVCYRELTRYAASAKIETSEIESTSGLDTKKSLLGAGRMEASVKLQQRIQNAADKAGLGVEIVLCGLQGVHPPPEVAKEYEEVVASVQEKQAAILTAQAEKNKILTELAGSIAQVDALYELALELKQSKKKGDQQRTEELENQLQDAFASAEGSVFKALRDAESYAFERVNLAKGEGLRFAGQIKAYQGAPEMYQKIQRLMMLEEALKNVRKYVVVADKEDSQIYIIDLQEKLETSLYDFEPGLKEE